MKLSERVRAGSEAAPWVIEAIEALEAEVRRLREQHEAGISREIAAGCEKDELRRMRDAALAERDEAKHNSERMRLAVDATAELLSAASAERDALKTDLRLTQGVLAAQHRLVAWGCRGGHNEDDCPLCSAEHSLLNTREALTEARQVLRKIEWVRIGGKMQPYCPFCWEQAKDGHAHDCALAAVLAQEEQA